MEHREISLEEKLKRCMNFEREEEVKIILEGIVRKLPSPQEYTIKRKSAGLCLFSGEDRHYAVVGPNKKIILKCYTGDSNNARIVEAIPSQEVLEAIEEIQRTIPRELSVKYSLS